MFANPASAISFCHRSCSGSHRHRSWKEALSLPARLSGVAWKSFPLLKGGSVAIRSMLSLLIPFNTGKLSEWNIVRFVSCSPSALTGTTVRSPNGLVCGMGVLAFIVCPFNSPMRSLL